MAAQGYRAARLRCDDMTIFLYKCGKYCHFLWQRCCKIDIKQHLQKCC